MKENTKRNIKKDLKEVSKDLKETRALMKNHLKAAGYTTLIIGIMFGVKRLADTFISLETTLYVGKIMLLGLTAILIYVASYQAIEDSKMNKTKKK